ncbi:hypothetical protein HUN43_00075 [Streptomyces phage Endor1]|uniref:Uncharacterized protein n=1 Tax=Streptomyces phage Endor1 TaxID=2740181 RepID=A0A7G4AWV7_9CAUD|nr:hypothetical protein KGG92_gp75 [Streptomyces phage Endor1]QMP84497.1 hypothetical protein HUN43_00075 [Streptomyces phage Endor1]
MPFRAVRSGSYSTSFPVGVQLVLPAGGAGSCCLAGSYSTRFPWAVQLAFRLTWDRSVRISCAPFAPAVRCGANRSRCLAELDSTRLRAAVQLGSECSCWPLTCDRTSTGLASRSVLRSGHSLHSLALRCQVLMCLRRSEAVSTWSESSSQRASVCLCERFPRVDRTDCPGMDRRRATRARRVAHGGPEIQRLTRWGWGWYPAREDSPTVP